MADYHVGVDDFNVLVGPNNSGKSTIISGLKYLAAAIQIARAKRPTPIEVDGRDRLGYWVPEQALPSRLDNVHTELEPTDSVVLFRFGSGRALELRFPRDGGCCLLLDPTAPVVDSPAAFRRHYNFRVAVLPVMSALEDDEELLAPQYVRRWAGTARSSRHFRNHWWYGTSEFQEFRRLLLRTWPEVSDISPPSLPEPVPPRLVMFCIEDGRPREVQWAGFGFQVWCQLITQILQVQDVDLLVIDEPEIYLHPDVQRRLVHLLREVDAGIVLATHSAEIISEVEASDLVVVDKRRSAGKRTSSPNRTRHALASIGSNFNIVLSDLVRTRHVLFLEGEDYKILRKWARLLGLDRLAAGVGLVTFPYGGFPTREGLRDRCRGIEAAVGDGERIAYAGVFDRDYRSDDEIDAIEEELGSLLRFVRILQRKEVESYLLIPHVLDAAMATEVARRRDRGSRVSSPCGAEELLGEITREFCDEVEAFYLAAHLRAKPRATGMTAPQRSEVVRGFAGRWASLDVRLGLVPGKRVFSRFLDECQERFSFSLTTMSVLQAFKARDVPFEIAGILRELEAFRKQAP